MADSTPDPINTVAAIPFYKSPTMIASITGFISAAIALFPKWGAAIGLKSAADVNAAVTAVFGFIAVIAPVVGSVLRAKSKVQPLTLTPAAAAANPNTVANVAATQATAAGQPLPPTPKDGK